MSTVDNELIAKFISEYPNRETTTDFSYEIARRKEFQELRLDVEEGRPENAGTAMKHQEMAARFISPNTQYQNLLVFHGLGSGKTCTGALIAEQFKETIVNGKPRRQTLIFVGSGSLQKNWSDEISRVCTGGHYLPQLSEAEKRRDVVMTDEMYIRRLNMKISETYKLAKIETFLKNLPDNENSAQWKTFERIYSNRVIIIDEAHTLRIQTSNKDSKSNYSKMFTFLHKLKNVRIILLTGTPVWDKAHEIAGLMNLILPMDEQLPTGNKFDLMYFDKDGNLKNSESLRRAFRGRVSYLRSSVAQKIDVGTTAPWFEHLTVFPDVMSDFQAKHAQTARTKVKTQIIKKKDKDGKTQVVERNVVGGSLLGDARDAANFVFPDGTYGKTGFDTHVKKTQKIGKKTSDIYRFDAGLKKQIRDNLREYSAKFASIIHQIQQYPNENVFVYNEFVSGSGAILFSMCLQEFGFAKAKTPNQSDPDKVSKKDRFAIFTSNSQTTSSDSDIQGMIRNFNDPRNKYGEYLRVIIGSEKVAVGLSLKNVRQVHIAMPHWNLSEPDQATFRALRFGGHNDLPKKERYVKVFNHCSVNPGNIALEGDEVSYPAGAKVSKNDTVDIHVYNLAEQKDFATQQVYRLLKESSYDCPLTYERNVLESDVSNSRNCNYEDQCNYTCDAYPEESIDKKTQNGVWKYFVNGDDLVWDTYNLYYNSKQVQTLISQIIEIYGLYFSLHLDEIIDLVSANDRMATISALDVIINNRILIKNRYGFGSYLKEQGNIYFLDNNADVTSSYSSVEYLSRPLLTQRSSLEDILESNSLKQDLPPVKEFCKNPTREGFSALSYKTQIILMEAVHQLQYKYKIDEINLTEEQLGVIEVVMDSIGDNVYAMKDGKAVHILYAQEFTGSSYNVIAKNIEPTGLMRVFNPATEEWSYIYDEDDELRYVTEVKDSLGARREIGFDGNPYGVYGSVSAVDSSFRIHVLPPKDKPQRRGKVCKNFKLPELVDIFVNKINHLPEPSAEIKDLDKEDLLRRIRGVSGMHSIKKNLNSKSEQYLRGLFTLLIMSIEDMCVELRQFFYDNDILFEL